MRYEKVMCLSIGDSPMENRANAIIVKILFFAACSILFKQKDINITLFSSIITYLHNK